MKAGLVAAELRKLADALDAQPDAETVKPYIWFMMEEKEPFLTTARLMPRPLVKEMDGNRIKIKHETPAMFVCADIAQHKTCELLEPAKPAVYRCAPILSEDEEEMVTA